MKQLKDEPGLKYDKDKIRLDLLPMAPLYAAGRVFTFGAEKYGDRNWEEGLSYSRLYAALLRHIFAFWDGWDFDPESHESPLAHALCCLMMLYQMQLTHKELDDRPCKKRMTTEKNMEACQPKPSSVSFVEE